MFTDIGMNLDARLTRLGIALCVERVPVGYCATDQDRYDGPESPYIAIASTAREAVEELVTIVEEQE